MTKKRKDVTYRLKQGHETVYIGTTNDPERREEQHHEEGKRFTRMEIASRRMTKDGAKQKEAEQLQNFGSNHGKNPRYNKDSDG